nr:hypothetical protein [Paenibacillus wynnii]
MLGITEKGMVDIEEKPSEVSIQLAAKLARFYNMPTSMITWN